MVHSSDPDARIGWTNDPAETTTVTGWLKIGRWKVFVWQWNIKVTHE